MKGFGAVYRKELYSLFASPIFYAVAFTFLVLVAFHFSIALSAIQSRESKMAQRVALLEARLNQLERDRAKDDTDPSRKA